MPATSHHRGNPTYFDEAIGEWRYSDNHELVKDTHRERPCGHCGEPRTAEGHDPCIGTLPGVMNACCGHGDVREAYVQLKGGHRIAGSDALCMSGFLNGAEPNRRD